MELDKEGVNILRNDLKHFSKLNDEIAEIKKLMKPLQDKIKILNNQKKELEKDICETMEANDLNEANVEGVGTIEYKPTKSTVPITQKTIKEKFILFFESGPGSEIPFNSKDYKDKGEDVYNYIYAKENRDTILKEKLVKKKIKG